MTEQEHRHLDHLLNRLLARIEPATAVEREQYKRDAAAIAAVYELNRRVGHLT